MEAKDFENRVRADAEMHAWLEEVLWEAGVEDEAGQTYLTGAEVAFSMAAYVLFRWAKDTLDHRRAQLELDIVERQVRVIEELRARGYTQQDAEATVSALWKAVAERGKDDILLKRALHWTDSHDKSLD